MRKGARVVLAACGVTAVFAFVPAVAVAATITPNIFTDEDAPNANCSVREAITAANSDGDYNGCNPGGADDGPDTINLTAGATYTLGGSVPLNAVEDANAAGDLDVFAEALTIQSVGTGRATIDGNLATTDRVLDVGPAAGTIAVTVDGLVLENGHGDPGGNVLNGAVGTTTLNLIDSVVRNNNVTTTSNGGGIFNARTLTLTDSTVSGNTASVGGGGINDSGTLLVTRSTISDNDATQVGASGGGILASGIAPNLLNSTVSGNTAGGDGGGIAGSSGVSLKNSTVTDNTADSDGAVPAQGGGGVSTATTADNSIIAGNVDGSPATNDPDCLTSITGTFDLVGDTTGCSVSGSNHVTDMLALLGPLTIANGGLTATHALLSGSPAINAANPATPDGLGTKCFVIDQRGQPRGGAAGLCDMGAFEAQPTPTQPPVTPPATTPTPTTPAPTPAKKCKKKKKGKKGAVAAKKCKKKKK